MTNLRLNTLVNSIHYHSRQDISIYICIVIAILVIVRYVLHIYNTPCWNTDTTE